MWISTKQLEIFCILAPHPLFLMLHSTETPQLGRKILAQAAGESCKAAFGLPLAPGVEEVHQHGSQHASVAWFIWNRKLIMCSSERAVSLHYLYCLCSTEAHKKPAISQQSSRCLDLNHTSGSPGDDRQNKSNLLVPICSPHSLIRQLLCVHLLPGCCFCCWIENKSEHAHPPTTWIMRFKFTQETFFRNIFSLKYIFRIFQDKCKSFPFFRFVSSEI